MAKLPLKEKTNNALVYQDDTYTIIIVKTSFVLSKLYHIIREDLSTSTYVGKATKETILSLYGIRLDDDWLYETDKRKPE